MSHFSLLVISKSPEMIDDMLVPFNEQTEDEKYIEFNDLTEEYLEEYNTKSCEMVKLENGSLVSPYDERFQESDGEFSKKTVIPEHLKRVKVPFNARYSSFEEFCHEYHGSDLDEKTGKYGYWRNPNAKWDWYEVGGRWANSFMMKTPKGSVRCDQCMIKDLDYEGILRKQTEEYTKYYNEALAFLSKKGDDDPESKHVEFRFGVDPRNISLEDYISNCVDPNNVISSFAIMTEDGKWYERGSMGWWGMVTDEKDSKEWENHLKELLSSIPDDRWITMVDCHI